MSKLCKINKDVCLMISINIRSKNLTLYEDIRVFSRIMKEIKIGGLPDRGENGNDVKE